jgi:uncharacterized surface protein with fasciclin (FAS1) repeats
MRGKRVRGIGAARSAGFLAAVLTALCSLAAAGCATGHSAATPTPSDSLEVGTAISSNGTFGLDCAELPVSGQGSLTALARDPMATATAHTALLSELAHAIRVAGLTGTLNSAKAITLFAPDNDAFTALGSGNVQTLLGSKSDLRKVLDYHLVSGRVTPAELAAGTAITTRLGVAVHPAKATTGYEINSAEVLCGNIQVANGTIYIVGAVLVP